MKNSKKELLAHIERLETTLSRVANIARTEKAENWDNVKERLWEMTGAFSTDFRFEIGPLKAYTKDQPKGNNPFEIVRRQMIANSSKLREAMERQLDRKRRAEAGEAPDDEMETHTAVVFSCDGDEGRGRPEEDVQAPSEQGGEPEGGDEGDERQDRRTQGEGC